MSLEAKLDTLNGLLQQVVTILSTGVQARAEFGAAETPAPAADTKPAKTTRIKKTDAAPTETVYWSVPKFNSVYAQEPGMSGPPSVGPNDPQNVQITAEEYAAKKQELAAKVDQVIADQPQGTTTGATSAQPPAPSQPTAEAAAAAAPAQSTATPAPQPSTATAATANSAADGKTFKDVLEVAKALNASQAPGHGRQGVLDVLKTLMPNDAAPSVPKLETSGVDMGVAFKAFSDKLNPPAAAEPDLF